MFELIKLTLAMSAAALFVSLLRKPLRRIAGAQAAYLLWLALPASVLFALLPSPWQLPQAMNDAIVAMTAVPTELSERAGALKGVLAAWAVGVLAMLALLVLRQRAFVRTLGQLSPLQNGLYVSPVVAEPMLVGTFQPRVVLPADFSSRYTEEERALVLAHEHAHAQRGDALVNAVAAVWLCLFWFNPLMHWAIRCFRVDQELACDALVLNTTGGGRRQYANALLKTQLAIDAAECPSLCCSWKSRHPLKERIDLLRRPLPGRTHRAFGLALTILLIVGASGASWAVQLHPRKTLRACALRIIRTPAAAETADKLPSVSP